MASHTTPLWLAVLALFTGCSNSDSPGGGNPAGPTRPADDAPIAAQRTASFIALDLLEEGAIAVLKESELGPVRAGDLWPSGLLIEGGEPRLSLILGAQSTVTFAVPDIAKDSSDRYIFQGQVGLDINTKELGAPLRLGVRVFEGEAQCGEAVLEFQASMSAKDNTWRSLSETPILLKPGSEVRIETQILAWGGAGEAPDKPVKFGISMPRLILEKSAPVRTANEDYPNIVFIVMDTLRQDRLGAYGYEAANTPNLDALAKRGLVYDDAHATSSWTWPSTASMLTGLLPEEHGVVDTNSCYLSSRFGTLAETLSEAGYATAGYSGNPLISPRRNFSQGFDEFLVDPQNFRPTPDMMPKALEWVEDHQAERFFLYMQLVDTHDPYTPLPAYSEGLHEQAPEGYPYTAVIDYGSRLRKRFAEDPKWDNWTEEVMSKDTQAHMSNLYDACVASADFGVGQLLDKLDALGLIGKTMIVFTSDHGDEFLDHGLLSHGQSLHGELTRAPLIIAGPNVEPGRESRTVSNRDLAHTLAKLGGGSLGMPGESQDLLQPSTLDDRAVFLSSHHGIRGSGHTPLFGVRKGEWLYSLAPEAKAPHERERLFRVSEDAAELVNLADVEKEMLQTLQKIVQSRLERSKETGPTQGFEAGDATLEFFQKIGYSGD